VGSVAIDSQGNLYGLTYHAVTDVTLRPSMRRKIVLKWKKIAMPLR